MDLTPEQLAGQLKKTIIGQDRYIQGIACSIWIHGLKYRRFLDTGEAISHPRTNILCLGESGTGKTLAVQTLAKLLDLPLVIEDASALRGSGWKGANVSSIIVHALDAAGGDDARARHAVVVLDEIDKVFHSQAADPNFYPVNNLLTLIGGSIVTHSDSRLACSMDTSSMLFICLGAFSGLEDIIHKRLSGKTAIGFGAPGYTETPREDLFRQATKEDLHEYGLSWEFLGRMPLIISTDTLTVADYKRILTDSLASPIQQYDDLLFNSLGIHVSISETAAEQIARQAGASKMGARGLSQIVTELLAPTVYSIGNDDRLSRLTLDLNRNGFCIKQEQGTRPVKEAQDQQTPDIPIPSGHADVLSSVPFGCFPEWNDITIYSLEIQKASEDAKWGPLSRLHPKQETDAAMCILQACICTQLMDDAGQEPTMYSLYQTVSGFTLSAIADSDGSRRLDRMRKEFANMALRHTPDLTKACRIAKYMIREYAFSYLHAIQV